jgi:hypothetical protein
MILEGYVDESLDGEWFTLAAIFTTGLRWQWLTVDWDRCITRWSKRMVASGRKPLRRYHGTDCAGRNEDFEGWTKTEVEEFLRELRTLIDEMDGTHIVSLSLKTGELAEVFELKTDKAVKRACYEVLLQYIMLQMGSDIDSRNPGYERVRVPLFHDHTKDYDSVMNRAFFSMMEDPNFRYKQYFTTISPMTWQHCIPLQPADMVAFESRKQVIRHTEGSPLGGEIKRLLDLPTFGGGGRYFRKDNLVHLKKLLDEIKHKIGHVPPTPKRSKLRG